MLSQTYFPVSLARSAALGGPVQEKRLNIGYKKQEQTEWCWAACIQMVLASDATSITQCTLANAAFNLTSCCQSPSSTLCNNPLEIFSVAAEWTRYHYLSTFVDAEASFATVRDGIRDNDCPVEAGLKWTGGGGHAVLIIGYSEVDGQDLIVFDPFEGEKPVTYQELVKAYNRGIWRWSWTGVKRDGTV
jgi:hypothetical protein